MKELIEVFRMNEIKAITRANIIIELGDLINLQYTMNLTEPVVYELVKELVPEHDILKNERYTKHL